MRGVGSDCTFSPCLVGAWVPGLCEMEASPLSVEDDSEPAHVILSLVKGYRLVRKWERLAWGGHARLPSAGRDKGGHLVSP